MVINIMIIFLKGETMNQEKLIESLLNLDLDTVMDDIMGIASVLDSNYRDKPSNYYMKYIQLSHLDLQRIIIADFINWLCMLGYSDGDFSIIELEFIKRYLRLDIPLNNLLQFCIDSIESGYLEKLPMSFMLFMEDDKEMNNIARKSGYRKEQDIASRLLLAYEVMGLHFIICDGNIDENEKVMFFGQTAKIRRMMDELDVEEMSEFYRQKLKDELGVY